MNSASAGEIQLLERRHVADSGNPSSTLTRCEGTDDEVGRPEALVERVEFHRYVVAKARLDRRTHRVGPGFVEGCYAVR